MNAPQRIGLPDIQASVDARDIAIDEVGIKNVRYPVAIMARGGSLFYDNATALELVAQTEKSLDVVIATKARAGSAAAAGTARLTSN